MSRMIIIGGGLAGALAANYFSSYKPTVFDQRPTGSGWGHKAVMRLRNPEMGYLLGCPVEKVTVTKNIYYKGRMYDKTNIQFSNMYSKKVSGGIGERSIDSLEPVDRYLMKSQFVIKDIVEDAPLHSIEKGGKAIIASSQQDYDICISTIPIDEMLRAIGMAEYADGFKQQYSPIYVYTYKLVIPCSVNQTVYFPSPYTPIYRATIEGDRLIVESMDSISSDSAYMYSVTTAFGLCDSDIGDCQSTIQPYGKLYEYDKALMKYLMMKMTEDYSIYSLGRFATWRNITADCLIRDLDHINRMIQMTSHEREYLRRTM